MVPARCQWGLVLSSAKDSSERTVSDTLPDGKKTADAASLRRSSSDPDRDTGSALRSIYQRTVEEQVPEEMLSLLSKLD